MLASSRASSASSGVVSPATLTAPRPVTCHEIWESGTLHSEFSGIKPSRPHLFPASAPSQFTGLHRPTSTPRAPLLEGARIHNAGAGSGSQDLGAGLRSGRSWGQVLQSHFGTPFKFLGACCFWDHLCCRVLTFNSLSANSGSRECLQGRLLCRTT